MKKLVFLLLMLPLSMQAQKDFDFKVFTNHLTATKNYEGKSDTVSAKMLLSFEKTANVIKAVNPTNTGDVTEYKIEYNGYSPTHRHFVYRVVKMDGEDVPNGMVIFINPILPTITVKTEHTLSIFE